MSQENIKFKQKLIKAVDSLYFPFLRPWIDAITFRYGLCGGINLVLDGLLYFIFYRFLYCQQDLDLGFVVISATIASFLTTFPIIFFTGFWLTKNISFQNTSKKSGQQRVKYLLVVILNIGVKYYGLKFLTLTLLVLPSVANIIMTIITVVISYILQRYFTFAKEK